MSKQITSIYGGALRFPGRVIVLTLLCGGLWGPVAMAQTTQGAFADPATEATRPAPLSSRAEAQPAAQIFETVEREYTAFPQRAARAPAASSDLTVPPPSSFREPASETRSAQTPPAPETSGTGPFQAMEDVLYYSYLNSPTLRASRAELKAVHERLPQALSGWMPRADLSGNVQKAWIDGSTFGGDGTTSKEFEVGVTQPLYRGGRTVSAVESAENVIKAQQLLLENEEQEFLVNVTAAYMNLLRDRSVLNLRMNNQSVITQQLQATQNRYDVGDITRTDVSQAQARLARADADLIQARGNHQKSRAAYTRLTGMEAGEMGRPTVRFNLPNSLSEAVAQAEANSPEIKASQYLHKAAEEDVDLIFGELMPELALFATWNRQYDPQPGLLDKSDTKNIGVQASVPLYEGGATRSRVRQAKYTANQRYLEILDAHRRVRDQVVASWEDLQAARAEIESRLAQVEAARIAREGVYQEAEIGTRTVLDSLDADQEYLDAQTALVGAERDEIVATFALMEAVGALTPQALAFPALAEDFDAHLQDVRWKILGMDVEIDNKGS